MPDEYYYHRRISLCGASCSSMYCDGLSKGVCDNFFLQRFPD